MPPALLPHETQTLYRQKYRASRPGWMASGDQFDFMVERWLTDRSVVLDLGCGRTGGIERHWQKAKLAVGIDPDLESLRDRKNGLPVVRGFGDHLPFADASFDVVVSVWVLEHLDAPGAVLAEVGRVMKPGGHFIFLTPNALNPLIVANRVGQLAPSLQHRLVGTIYGRARADTFAVRYRANTARRLRKLAKRSGFAVMEMRVIPDPTYVAFNPAMYHSAVLAERFLPESLGVHILGDFLRR